MSISALFKNLGAPLHNIMWSWGAVRATDGVVFLRVWQDECRKINNRLFMRITANEHFQRNDPNNLGYQERLYQIDLIKDGAKSYMVICVARDVEAVPRAIIRFNSNEVFEGGELIFVEGNFWLEFGARVPVRNIRL